MCRNIKTLHNFKPPATEDEIRASSLQFVRKLSGFARPSKANQLAFDRAVDQVAGGNLVIVHLPDLAGWSNGNIQCALGDVDADEDEGLGD